MSEKEQEDASKMNIEESNQKEYNDRKRKRSPSPAEAQQASPVPQKGEDEPDLDESAMILSWCKFLEILYIFLSHQFLFKCMYNIVYVNVFAFR